MGEKTVGSQVCQSFNNVHAVEWSLGFMDNPPRLQCQCLIPELSRLGAVPRNQAGCRLSKDPTRREAAQSVPSPSPRIHRTSLALASRARPMVSA